jgi:hypothetical protein
VLEGRVSSGRGLRRRLLTSEIQQLTTEPDAAVESLGEAEGAELVVLEGLT